MATRPRACATGERQNRAAGCRCRHGSRMRRSAGDLQGRVRDARWDWTMDSPRLAGTRSLIARLAQRLQAAGWAVSVRALLSDCNTARKVAGRPRRASAGLRGPYSPCEIRTESGAERDEAAAEVLSVGYFTTLQVLFLICPVLRRAWWASSSPWPTSKSARSSRPPASRRSSSWPSACTRWPSSCPSPACSGS